MASGFVQLDGHLAGRETPLANFDLAELSAVGTGLRLTEQLGLLQSQVLSDLPRDRFADPAGGDFDAGKGSCFSSHVGIVQINAKFFREVIDNTLILVRP